MERLKRFFIRIAASEYGQDMVEYALITTLVSLVVVLATAGLISPAFSSWGNDVAGCVSAPESCPF